MITISGGEILRQIGTSVTYKLKCDNCGQVEQSESTVTVTVGVTEITTKKCPNCGKNQLVKMKHSIN